MEQGSNPNSTQSSVPEGAANAAIPAAEENQKKILYGILSYIGILVVVSYILAKDIPGVKFHIKQGAVLFFIEVTVMIITNMLYILAPLTMVVNIACIVFSVIGIVNVVNHREKELPIIGQFAKHVPI